ncbi:TPA: klcB [Vibrio harveyi]|nr:klcB [Vibrio harveyi]
MMYENNEREESAAKLAASMPAGRDDLLSLALKVVDEIHSSVLASDNTLAKKAIDKYQAVIWKLNGGRFFGCANGDDSPAAIVEDFCCAKSGDVPKWGQSGKFVVIVDAIRVLVEFGSLGSWGNTHFEFKPVDLDSWFISPTGYRSHIGELSLGLTVDEAAKAILSDYLKDKRHDIKPEYRDILAKEMVPNFLDALTPSPRRSPANVDVPEGFVLVDVVLPSQKAYIAKKWAKEAQNKLSRIKRECDPSETAPVGSKPRKMVQELKNVTPGREQFVRGQRCQVISVHHPVFENDIGKFVIITDVSSSSSQVWAYDDKPETFRINRKGNRVIEHDPKTVQSIYSFKQLRLASDTE